MERKANFSAGKPRKFSVRTIDIQNQNFLAESRMGGNEMIGNYLRGHNDNIMCNSSLSAQISSDQITYDIKHLIAE